MEFDQTNENPLFPEYSSSLSKFFNTDTNTTTGVMKLGDLETGALVTVNFKTMPYSANQYMYADPYLVYDMSVEINNKGSIEVIHAIKPEDVLTSKKIFVPLL